MHNKINQLIKNDLGSEYMKRDTAGFNLYRIVLLFVQFYKVFGHHNSHYGCLMSPTLNVNTNFVTTLKSDIFIENVAVRNLYLIILMC